MEPLDFAKARFQALKARLRTEFEDLDEQTLADTVEDLTDLHEVLGAIIRSAVTDEALGLGLRSRIGEMQGRLARLEDRASKRRLLARDVMLECDIKKIAAPDFTVFVRPGSPSVQVTDESAIPEKYWEPRDPRLNRQSLGADLKAGALVAGALLSNPEPVLSVRVK